MSLQNKKILLIIGGGISAYKSLDLIRLLQRRKSSVKVVLTKSGKKFVTPLSVSSLLKNKVFEEMFEDNNKGKIDHIALSRWADLVLVLPATANFMSKLSRGSADDLASTIALASNREIFLAPAMNVRMWLHKATQKNLKSLIEYGYKFIGPVDGDDYIGGNFTAALNFTSTLLLAILFFSAATAVAQAAVPQAFVSPAPRSQTFIFILLLSIISANVTLTFSGNSS